LGINVSSVELYLFESVFSLIKSYSSLNLDSKWKNGYRFEYLSKFKWL